MQTAVNTEQSTLAYYTQPATYTSPGAYASSLDGLPTDVASLAELGHGLLIHEHIAPAYGVTLTDQQRLSVHFRPIEAILEQVLTADGRSLNTPRAPEARTPGNCRHFTLLFVAMLRHQGVPSRARCGFGGYFGGGNFEDHWVAEYWNAAEHRWVLVDAQIDAVQRAIFPIDFDLTDVPRDRFVIAGDAWVQCRAGQADPNKYGLSLLNEAGLWWIAGNMLRDAAALNNREMLPWDVWGAMPAPDETITEDQLALFDHLAPLTQTPDASFADLQSLYTNDDRLRVPDVVFNAVLQRQDTL